MSQLHNIIAISGASGAGKSTIVKGLAKKLNATAIFWDEYDEITKGPSDYVKWFNEGEDYSKFKYDALVNTLSRLKEGKKLLCPIKNIELVPTKFIIFDAPMGRKHEATGTFIDLQIHLDTPLDISLARRLIRDFKNNNFPKEKLIDELEFYLYHSRRLFFMTKVKESADIIIDGSLLKDKQLNLIIEKLHNYHD